MLTVSTALETFLNDRFSPCDYDDSPLFAGDSPVSTEIAEAGSHLAQGLFRLVELVDGRRVYMTSGPWLDQLDPYDDWHGSLRWDVSKDQTSSPPGGPAMMTTDILTLTRVAGEEKAGQYVAMTALDASMHEGPDDDRG